MPTMSFSASSSNASLFCPCHGPGIFFLFPEDEVGGAKLDGRELDWDCALAPESVREGVAGRRVRIFGIDGRKCLAC